MLLRNIQYSTFNTKFSGKQAFPPAKIDAFPQAQIFFSENP
jgi:hypothetical protein